MRIARVFPRRTKATPTDALAFVGGPGLFPPEVDAVHVSVAFTWDIPKAERLAREWEHVAPVSLGGPAMGTQGDDFTPGMYLREGYTITSRGCPNHCWFCAVPKRDGDVRELPIADGWNVLDDNLLACGDNHIRMVVAMLGRQRREAAFTGGLEAARLRDWHLTLFQSLSRQPVLFFAYDTPNDWEPLAEAAMALSAHGFAFAGHRVRAYVLIGYRKDTPALADIRLRAVKTLGITPMAMLWRDGDGTTSAEWRRLQRAWARPAIIHSALPAPEPR